MNEATIQVYRVDNDGHGGQNEKAILNIDHKIPSTIAPGGSRSIGWLSSGESSISITFDEDFVFTPKPETIGLRVVVDHPMDVVPENNSAFRSIEFTKPDYRVEIIGVRRGESETSPPSGYVLFDDVEPEEEFTFRLRAYSTDIPEEPVPLRIRRRTPRTCQGGQVIQTDSIEMVSFDQSRTQFLGDGVWHWTEVEVIVPHEFPGRYYIDGHINPFMDLEESEYSNNIDWFRYTVEMPDLVRNLVVANLRYYNSENEIIDPDNFVVGAETLAVAELEVLEAHVDGGLTVEMSYGDPFDASSLSLGEPITLEGPFSVTTGGEPYMISFPVTFDRPFHGDIFMGVNLDGKYPESEIFDNVVGVRTWVREVEEADLPDLVDSHFRGLVSFKDFVNELDVYRGHGEKSIVNLRSYVLNTNLDVPVDDPFKVQVYLGSSVGFHGDVIAERIFTPGDSIGQVWAFNEQWMVGETPAGAHDLYLVIDPLNHLAARGRNSGTPSVTPLKASSLDSDRGVRLVNNGGLSTIPNIAIEVYSTDCIEVGEGNRIGRWTSVSGFVNESYDQETDTYFRWSVEDAAPVMLVVENLDEEVGLEQWPEGLSLEVTITDDLGLIGTTDSTVSVKLPSNVNGEWGNGVAFWVANDGSTYFAQRYHLAVDFTGGAFSGSYPADMDALSAMTDASGTVEEFEEISNNIVHGTVIVRDAPVDLRVALADPPAEVPAGSTVPFEVTVSNVGAPTNSFFTVRLEVSESGVGPLVDAVARFERVIATPVAVGSSRTVIFDWWTREFSGDYDVVAWIDYDPSIIPDSNPENDSDIASGTVINSISLDVHAAPDTIGSFEETTVTLSLDSVTTSPVMVELELFQKGSDSPVSVPSSLPLPHYLTLHPNEPIDVTVVWNSGERLAGEYFFRGLVLQRLDHEYINPIVADSNVVTIEPELNLRATVSTNQDEYGCSEPVYITATVDNEGRNFGFSGLKAEIEITDSLGTRLYHASRDVGPLGAKGRRVLQFAWTEPLVFNPDLTVVLHVHDIQTDYSALAEHEFVYCARDMVVLQPTFMGPTESNVRFTSESTVLLDLSMHGVDGIGADAVLMSLTDGAIPTGPGRSNRNLFPNASVVHATEGLPSFWLTGGSGLVAPVQNGESSAIGDYSLRFDASAGDVIATEGSDGLPGSGIIVQPNQEYVLSFLARSEVEDSWLRIHLVETDGDGYSTPTLVGSLRVSGAEWHREQVALMTGEDSVTVGFRFEYHNSPAQEILLDGFQFEPGRVATSFVDSDFVLPGDAYAMNLLANPSLILDEGRPWVELLPSLSGAADVSVGSAIPDGWELAEGSDGLLTIIEGDVPGDLSRRGVDEHLTIQSGSELVSLTQGLLPVVGLENVSFSVYGAGQLSQLGLGLEFYDSNEDGIQTSGVEDTFLLSSSWNHYSVFSAVPVDAAYVKVYIISSNRPSGLNLVAAQLEAGTEPSPWSGFVGWKPLLPEYNLVAPEVEGVKLVTGHALSGNNRRQVLSSTNLTRDPGGTGRFASSMTGDASYTVRGMRDGVSIPFFTSALFDGSSDSHFTDYEAVEKIQIDFQLPQHPTVVEMSFTLDEAPPFGSGYKLKGRLTPGVWQSVRDGSLEAGTTFLEELHTKFDAYRLELVYSVPDAPAISSIRMIGYEYDGMDILIYDISPPEGIIALPGEEYITAADDVTVVIDAHDEISGLAEVNVRLVQGLEVLAPWQSIPVDFDQASFEVNLGITDAVDGIVTIEAYLVDLAGNTATLNSREFLVDRTPPLLTVAHFFDHDLDSEEWTRTDNDLVLNVFADDLGLSPESIRADLSIFGLGQSVAADGFDTTGRAYWNLSFYPIIPPDGLVRVSMHATDQAGNVSDIVFAETVLDNAPPRVFVNSTPNEYFEGGEVILTGSLMDNPGGELDSAVYSIDDGETWSPLDIDIDTNNPSMATFTIEISALLDGVRCILFEARDIAGNTTNPPFEHCVIVDGVGPVIEYVRLYSLELDSDEYIRDGDTVRIEVLFAVDTIVPGSIRGDFTMLGYGSGTPLSVDSPIEGRLATWTLPDVNCMVSDGVTTVTVSARDIRGRTTFDVDPNQGTGWTYSDNTPPQLDIVQLPPVLNPDTPPALIGTISDAWPGKLASAEYRIRNITGLEPQGDWTSVDGVPPVTEDTSETTFTISLDGLPDGLYELKVRAYDKAEWLVDGGVYTYHLQIDRVPPSLELKIAKKNDEGEFVGSQYVRNDDSVRVTGFLRSGFVPQEYLLADLSSFLDGNSEHTQVQPDNFDHPVMTWDIESITTLPQDGRTTVSVTATDFFGRAATMDSSIIADNTAPTTVTIQLGEQYPGEATQFGVIRFFGIAEDPPPGVIGSVEYQVNIGENQGEWLRANSGSGNYSEPYHGIVVLGEDDPDGIYEINVIATDKAGNVSSPTLATLTVNVDRSTQPTIKYARMRDVDIHSQEFTRDSHSVELLTRMNTATFDNLGSGTLLANFSTLGGSDEVEATSFHFPYAYWDLETVDTGGISGFAEVPVWLDGVPPQPSDVVTIMVDNTPPMLYFGLDEEAVFPTAEVAISGVVIEEHSFVGGVTVGIDGITTDTIVVNYFDFDATHYSYPFLYEPGISLDDGIHTAFGLGIDIVGNQQIEPTLASFRVDTIPPVASLEYAGPPITNDPDSLFTAHFTDLDGSGIKKAYYHTDAATDWVSLENLDGPLTECSATFSIHGGLGEGARLVRVKAYDYAGHVSNIAEIELLVDFTPPVIAIDSPTTGTWYKDSVELSWVTEDIDLLTSHGLLTWVDFDQQPGSFEPQSGDQLEFEGHFALEAWGIDVAGNVGEKDHVEFGLDWTPPALYLDPIPARTGNDSHVISGTLDDHGGSGAFLVSYSFDGEIWNEIPVEDGAGFQFNSQLVEGVNLLQIFGTDNAENVTAVHSYEIELDTVGPVVAIDSPTSGTWYSEAVV
ncbi:MAG: Ig-like domain repeat protein, partial [Candidatus Sumerlaeia bacterium]|nr:Ig-like domain repeat protein [Candidatus Sumerlaeia bacterium]